MAGYNNNNYYKSSHLLHPYYVPSWNNPLAPMAEPLPMHHRHSNGAPRPDFYPQKPSSPAGLTEVLSSYTPGPTIIMIEKKKRPSFASNKYVRLACLCIMILTVAAFIWTRVFSKSENSSFLEPEIEPFIQIPLGKDNLSGCTYLKSHKMYTNVVFSYDDDEETFVEDVKTFAL